MLAETVAWLRAHGYQVFDVTCARWQTPANMLRDLADYEYGADERAAGTLLTLTNFDAFAKREPAVADAVLRIYADQARTAALIGHRMLCLVQSDNLRLTAVGFAPVPWNPAEWLDSRREASANLTRSRCARRSAIATPAADGPTPRWALAATEPARLPP